MGHSFLLKRRLHLNIVQLAVLVPVHAQSFGDLRMGLQPHLLELFRRFGNQLQRQFLGFDPSAFGFILKSPLKLLLLFGRAELADFVFERGMGRQIFRQGGFVPLKSVHAVFLDLAGRPELIAAQSGQTA